MLDGNQLEHFVALLSFHFNPYSQIGKPLQNRPIAPASGALAGMIPGGHLAPGLVASGMQGFGAGHALLASMMRMPQPAFSHVPAGAAAGAALAGVTPRNTSLRTPSIPPSVKPLGLSTQAHASGGQSQTHVPATTTGSSRPSSPGASTPHLATAAVATSMHQPGSEHKTSEMREARPALMSDLARRGASPTVQSMGAAHPPAPIGGKVINIVPSAAIPQTHQVQKSSVPTLPSHHPSSVHSGMPVTAVGVSSVSSGMSHMPSPGTGMSGHAQQSKVMASSTVSVAPAILTTTAKLYTPPHHLAFTAPRQGPISSSDTTMVCDFCYLWLPLDILPPTIIKESAAYKKRLKLKPEKNFILGTLTSQNRCLGIIFHFNQMPCKFQQNSY